ncbi:hypothetical protein D7Z54_10450 [Salibacterium salarium]|uniref:Uncharacterized protein n=1 Tax=Salibacterium salarium TaxID=284579 RepID=A0A3R9PLE2_9BACI|nr:hypothetical protein [Salibacterium salarium]RSL33384.1 hypothetical protein D7Z54_10450 [Salibacterium salarium]
MTNINLDKRTVAMIKKNGGAVTLNPLYIFNQNKQRGPIDVMLTFDTPEADSMYQIVSYDGINIYIHENLKIKKELRIRISGFGPFQHLSCSGIKHFRKKSTV